MLNTAHTSITSTGAIGSSSYMDYGWPMTAQHHPQVIQSVIPFFLIVPGTGGLMTIQSTEALSHWLYIPQIHIEHSTPHNIDTRSPAEHIANIRDVLKINMSDLATVFGVSRPTVYAWQEGQEPKSDAVKHIFRISQAADKIRNININRIDKLLTRPVFNGHSLIDLLKTEDNLSDAIFSLKKIADREEQRRKQPKGSSKYLRPLEEVSQESSSAIFVEG